MESAPCDVAYIVRMPNDAGDSGYSPSCFSPILLARDHEHLTQSCRMEVRFVTKFFPGVARHALVYTLHISRAG